MTKNLRRSFREQLL